jgi:hypothetical protein
MPRRDHFHAVQRKFYQSRRFRNPYFQHVQKKNFVPLIAGICVVAGAIGLTCFLLASPRFAYANVTVEGTTTIAPEDVSSVVRSYLGQSSAIVFKRSNRFLFRPDALRKELGTRFAFESLEIATEQSNIHVVVKEKTSQLLWTSMGRTYVVARDGLVIRELAEAEKSDQAAIFASFTDLNDVAVTIGQQVMTPDEIDAIFRFHDHLRAQLIPFHETRMDRQIGKWVNIITDVGYGILIDPSADIDIQATNLDTVLRESVPDQTKLEYVDLRFDDHVYYKFR